MNKEMDNTVLCYIQNHEELELYAKPGLCRVWSGKAREILYSYMETNHEEGIVEAREVEIEPGLSHTFLKLIVNSETYLLDGTGVGNFPHYFGEESKAPSHLKNSQLDWIEIYG
jgi:hypothetical protein